MYKRRRKKREREKSCRRDTDRRKRAHSSHNIASHTLNGSSVRRARVVGNESSNIINTRPGVGLGAQILADFSLHYIAMDAFSIDKKLIQS